MSRAGELRSTGFWATVAGLFLLAAAAALLLRETPKLFLGGVGILAGGGWVYFCARRPLTAFLVVLVLMTGFYKRASIPLGGGAAVSVADLLWLGILAGFVLIGFPRGIPWPANGRFRFEAWMMMPYLGLATLLPIAGVAGHGHSLSYVFPGLRQLHWASLAPLTAYLCARYGVHRVSLAILKVMLAVALAHVVYGLVQFLHGMGLLGGFWVSLDWIYASMMGDAQYYYPRATGWLTNPNALGAYAALLFGIAFGFRPQGFNLFSRRFQVLVLIAAVAGVILSGSRSGLLGVFAIVVLLVLMSMLSARVATGGLVGTMLLVLAVLLALPLLQDVLPEVISQRFGRILAIFQEGTAADPTANARMEEWKRIWALYLHRYPLGTWSAPSYVLQSPVDSYYVFTATQGTPLFTLVWLTFLAGAAMQGLAVFGRSRLGDLRGLGLVLLLWAGAHAAMAAGMSPMLQTHLIGAFWVLIGLTHAALNLDPRESP